MAAETIRIATFNTELSRKGPGLLLRDIMRGKDPQPDAVAKVIATSSADIILLTNVDYDLGLLAVTRLRDLISAKGNHYPYIFARRPNSGMPTGLDMDGDGRLGQPRDNQGYGRFNGQGGMAILSRYPIDHARARDFSGFLWRDMVGALLPKVDGKPFPSRQAQDIQRLSSVGHWDVPIVVPNFGKIHLLVFHATPPVFDGPEDRNGKRNHDETRFWQRYLDGAFGPSPKERFVIVGDANMDPNDGTGITDAIRALLADRRLQDPRPKGGGAAADNPTHIGDPALDTVDWPDPDPGNLRVDYVLPSADFQIGGAAVMWPKSDDPFYATVVTASRHRLVWVDLDLP